MRHLTQLLWQKVTFPMKVILFLVFFAALPCAFVIPYVGPLLGIILIAAVIAGGIVDIFK